MVMACRSASPDSAGGSSDAGGHAGPVDEHRDERDPPRRSAGADLGRDPVVGLVDPSPARLVDERSSHPGPITATTTSARATASRTAVTKSEPGTMLSTSMKSGSARPVALRAARPRA